MSRLNYNTFKGIGFFLMIWNNDIHVRGVMYSWQWFHCLLILSWSAMCPEQISGNPLRKRTLQMFHEERQTALEETHNAFQNLEYEITNYTLPNRSMLAA